MSRYSRRPSMPSGAKPQKPASFKMRDSKNLESTKDFSPRQEAKVEKVLHEYKKGTLKTRNGKKVTSRKQAVAIGLSEARRDEQLRATTQDHKRTTPKTLKSEPFHKDDVDGKYPHRTAILVPATKNGSEPISRAEHKKRVEETERFMSKEYGGYTAVKARGGYQGDNGELIEEPVTEVVAYTDEKTFQEKKPVVRKYLSEKRGDWSQESIGYENDSSAQLYYFKNRD